MFGSPWYIVIGLGIPLIYIAVIGFALVVVLRLAFRGKGMNTKAVHVELVRIVERPTSIEKLLKDIEQRHGPGLLFAFGSWEAYGT